MATAKKLPSGSWRCQVYDYTAEKENQSHCSMTFGQAFYNYIKTRESRAGWRKMSSSFVTAGT